MTRLETWWTRAARRAERAVRLEDALLGGRFAAYAVHRLRYLGARTLVGTVLHAARIILAFRLFRPAGFAAILVLEAITAIAGGFWWGTLEILRGRVRELFRDGRQREAGGVIGTWLSRALRGAALTAAAALLWIPFRLAVIPGSFSPLDLYIAAVLLRFALDIVDRCYHSGIYAVRRVYRPLLSLLIVEFVSFGAVLGTWPLIKAWALPAAALVSALAAAGMVFHFSARAYRHVGLAPWKSAGLFRRTPRSAGRWTEGLPAGAAYAALRLDGIIPLLVVASPGRGRLPFAAFLLSIAPLVRAASDWAQLFYFDLKKLDLPILKRVRIRFEERMGAASIPIGVLLGLAAFTLNWAVPGRADAWFGALLVLFFVSRSRTAALQMRAFASEDYGAAIWSGLIGAAGWIPAGRIAARPLAALGLGAAALALASLPVLRRRDGRGSPGRPVLSPLSDWMERVKSTAGYVSLSAAVFSPGSVHRGGDDPVRWAENDRWSHRRVGEAVALKLGARGAAALAGPGRIVWFETGGGREAATPEWLLVQSAGLIRSIKTTGKAGSGGEALRRAAEIGLFGETVAVSKGGSGEMAARLIAEFRRLSPRGAVFDMEARPALKRDTRPASAELRRTFGEALAYAADFSDIPRNSRFETTAFIENGGIRLIFLADAGTPGDVRERWRRRLRRANLQASIY